MQTSLEDVVLFNNSSSLFAIQIVHYCVLCGILGNQLVYILFIQNFEMNRPWISLKAYFEQEAQNSKNISACFFLAVNQKFTPMWREKPNLAVTRFDQISNGRCFHIWNSYFWFGLKDFPNRLRHCYTTLARISSFKIHA